MMPIWVMRTGNQLGHIKLSPPAEPILRNTPKPAFALKLPSPMKAKLRASPPSFRDPTVTSAPTDVKLTSSSLSAALVLMYRSIAVSVRKLPSVTLSVSTLNTRPLTRPPSNSRETRMASVSGKPGARSGSEVTLSLSVADIGRPGRNRAPPEAMKMVPSKPACAPLPKVTLKSVTPMRRSSNSRMSPKAILPDEPPVWLRPDEPAGSAPPSGS